MNFLAPAAGRGLVVATMLSTIMAVRYYANLKFTLSGAAMPEYIQAIERYLLDNPKLSKSALVELLTKRFSNLPADEAWTIVSRYFNNKA